MYDRIYKNYLYEDKDMKFHYGGKYNNEDDLKAKREVVKGAVAFKEPEHGAFAFIANAGCLVLVGLLLFGVYFIGKPELRGFLKSLGLGAVLSFLVLIPHEFLHAICFKEDVYLYLNFEKFLAFVHGTEDMSKGRFIFMSMLPNLVFGLIPYVIFLINHDLYVAGVIGAFCFGMGFGDYINVFNALTQMPKGSKTFLSGFHSYWYKG